jgi:phosphomannomutase
MSIPASKSLRISHVGLRGIVGAALTANHALDFSCAFGTFLEPGGCVIVGRDPRASGVMMREAVVAGLMACGRDVIDLGLAPTPVIQHSIRRHDAAGGVSIGASHNSAEWNALKFFGRQGTYLSTPEASELLDIYHLRKFDFVEWHKLGKVHAETGAIDRYLDDLATTYDLNSLTDFRVVVDCCNGMSAPVLRRLNERFGTSFILINETVEGVAYAHEPSTTARTVGLQLAPLMRPLQADAGFLFDLDSDRVAMADETGTPVSEEMVLPMLADYLLPRASGKLVITNLSTTALVEEVAARHGGTVVRVPVGRQATIDALASYRPEQIAVAGEGSGAVMIPRFRFVYDGIASMLAVLSLMKERGESLGGILAGYPRHSILKGQLPLVTQRIPALLAELREIYSDGRANVADGLRVDWPGRWFHVRVSQTEPVVRVICERKGDPPRAMFDALMDKVRSYA